jgi:hypothetical protein
MPTCSGRMSVETHIAVAPDAVRHLTIIYKKSLIYKEIVSWAV